jgi:hypothetical protein
MGAHHSTGVRWADPKQKAADFGLRGLFSQRFEEGLLVVVSSAPGEDSTIGHGDLGLSDSVGLGLFGANATDLNFVPDLQRIRSPSLSEQRIRRAAFDGINDSLAGLVFRFNVHVDVGIHPVDALHLAVELDWLIRIEFGRYSMMCKQRNGGSKQAYAEPGHNPKISFHRTSRMIAKLKCQLFEPPPVKSRDIRPEVIP